MDTATTKQSFWKNIFQRLQVVFGPKRLALEAGIINVSAESIDIPNEFTFDDVISSYKNYTLKTNGKSGKTIISNETLEEIDDSALLQKLEFANTWRKCASGNLADESDELALPICFSDEAKETYDKISKYSIMHLTKYGHIDTKEVLDVTKEMEYRWSRQTARKLFKNEIQAQLVTDYYRLATPSAKKQNQKTLTTDQALYGLDN